MGERRKSAGADVNLFLVKQHSIYVESFCVTFPTSYWGHSGATIVWSCDSKGISKGFFPNFCFSSNLLRGLFLADLRFASHWTIRKENLAVSLEKGDLQNQNQNKDVVNFYISPVKTTAVDKYSVGLRKA